MSSSLHRKSFDNEEKGIKIMKLSYDITKLTARPSVWAGSKGMIFDPFMCEIGSKKRETG